LLIADTCEASTIAGIAGDGLEAMKSTPITGGSYGANIVEGVLEPSLKRQGTSFYSGDGAVKVIVPEMLFRMPVKSVRVWIREVETEANSTIMRNHNPFIMVKRINTDWFGKEIEIVLAGDYHLEKLSYYRKNPSEWQTMGAIYLTIPEAIKLSTMLMNLVTFNTPQDELEKACSSLLRLRQLQV
jgi:hypothetical protein